MKKITVEETEEIPLSQVNSYRHVGFTARSGAKNILVRQWDDTFIPVCFWLESFPTIWANSFSGKDKKECLLKVSSMSGHCALKNAFAFSSMEEMLLWAAKKD